MPLPQELLGCFLGFPCAAKAKVAANTPKQAGAHTDNTARHPGTFLGTRVIGKTPMGPGGGASDTEQAGGQV